MTIGKRIRTLREKQGMSQAELGRRTGIKREYLSKLESGALPNPTLSTMQKFADGLGVKVKDLVDDDECNQTGALLAKIVSTENQRLEAVGALENASARLSHTLALLRQSHAKEQPPCTKP
jgi:transcriptional regulator with XRE-family HTH domain